MPGPPPTPAIQRLLARLDTTSDGCWLWPGATNGRGYGVIGASLPGRRRRCNAYVHRIMYEHTYGAIPDGLEVCHECDIRNCCQPKHLFLGTHSENVADQLIKGRIRRGRDLYWSVKMTEDSVREMRRRHTEGETAATLAREFNISASQAEFIIRRLRWKHVT